MVGGQVIAQQEQPRQVDLAACDHAQGHGNRRTIRAAATRRQASSSLIPSRRRQKSKSELHADFRSSRRSSTSPRYASSRASTVRSWPVSLRTRASSSSSDTCARFMRANTTADFELRIGTQTCDSDTDRRRSVLGAEAAAGRLGSVATARVERPPARRLGWVPENASRKIGVPRERIESPRTPAATCSTRPSQSPRSASRRVSAPSASTETGSRRSGGLARCSCTPCGPRSFDSGSMAPIRDCFRSLPRAVLPAS